jgi:hypothetical protein
MAAGRGAVRRRWLVGATRVALHIWPVHAGTRGELGHPSRPAWLGRLAFRAGLCCRNVDRPHRTEPCRGGNRGGYADRAPQRGRPGGRQRPDPKWSGRRRPGPGGTARRGTARRVTARPGNARPGNARPGNARPGNARPGNARPVTAGPRTARCRNGGSLGRHVGIGPPRCGCRHPPGHRCGEACHQPTPCNGRAPEKAGSRRPAGLSRNGLGARCSPR